MFSLNNVSDHNCAWSGTAGRKSLFIRAGKKKKSVDKCECAWESVSPPQPTPATRPQRWLILLVLTHTHWNPEKQTASRGFPHSLLPYWNPECITVIVEGLFTRIKAFIHYSLWINCIQWEPIRHYSNEHHSWCHQTLFLKCIYTCVPHLLLELWSPVIILCNSCRTGMDQKADGVVDTLFGCETSCCLWVLTDNGFGKCMRC